MHPDFSHSPPGTPGAHVTAMASYQDGADTVLLVGARNGLVRRIDPVTGLDVGAALRHESSVESICVYAVDGEPQVGCGTKDGSVWRWNAITGDQAGSPLLGNRSDVYSVLSYSIGGEVFLAGASTGVWRWNAVTGERVDNKIGSAVANYLAMQDVSTGLAVVYGSDQTVLVASDGGSLFLVRRCYR